MITIHVAGDIIHKLSILKQKWVTAAVKSVENQNINAKS